MLHQHATMKCRRDSCDKFNLCRNTECTVLVHIHLKHAIAREFFSCFASTFKSQLMHTMRQRLVDSRLSTPITTKPISRRKYSYNKSYRSTLQYFFDKHFYYMCRRCISGKFLQANFIVIILQMVR